MRPIDFFDRGARIHPERPFVIDENGMATSHADAQALSHRTVLAMLAAGYQRGQHAAIYSPNHPRAFAALLGIFRAGGAWVPINARSAIDEIAFILDHNDARFLFYHSQFAADVEIIRVRCSLTPSRRRSPALRPCFPTILTTFVECFPQVGPPGNPRASSGPTAFLRR